ncbi:pectate lyase [Streptomyces sp. NPDC017993]|uniref:pectate lyase n=1 Tax=Streptomyces sp. NPDC017993 TaxID=3365027 RepID=UPI00379CB48F
MTTRAQRRRIHRRRVQRRRTLAGLVAALGMTGAALTTSVLLAPAGAAGSWPSPSGGKAVTETIEVSGTFDGGLKRYRAGGELGDGGQGDGRDAVFTLKDGAELTNVVLSPSGADGVHCLGSCTLRNVWWEDVGEEAATFEGTSADAVYTVTGGGARHAADTVFQFNGMGKLKLSGFQAVDFGKLVGSCANCRTQYRRSVIVHDVDLTAPGKEIAAINVNYGDIAELRDIRLHGDSGGIEPSTGIEPCVRYLGNNTGAEPARTGSGPDGINCRYAPGNVSSD